MTKLGPHGAGRLAVFLRHRITELAPVKNQTEIAREAGFVNPPMLSMIKTGQSKLPLDRVAALARALDVDPKHLWLLALEQQGNATTATEIAEIFGSIVTTNELAWIEAVREASDMTDPPLTKRARAAVFSIFGKGAP